MGQIRVLPASLVNRIAAGECVERPASVVKELIENSLDAGASRIDVSILDGGRGLIQVSDDGLGMDVDDLKLSITPHATSKIQTDEDLFNIHTMGFRGEALPSIGAVSRLQVTSRRRDSDVGHLIRVEAGERAAPTPCAAPVGTTVEVRDLFYCVPARRKFLRTTATEMGHITEQFARLALAHPGVALALKHQNRELHRLGPTPDRRQRIADFYGPDLAEALLPVGREGGGVLVEGYAAPPAHCRKSGKWEYVFVNGRYIRDRFVSHAVKEGYRSLIQPNEYPVIFLFITIDPAQLDVNVHPTKAEVRWRDSNYIHGQVLAALRDKFLSTNLDRALQVPADDDEGYRQGVRAAMVDFFTKGGPPDVAPGTAARRHAGTKEWDRGAKGSRDQGIKGPSDQGIKGSRDVKQGDHQEPGPDRRASEPQSDKANVVAADLPWPVRPVAADVSAAVPPVAAGPRAGRPEPSPISTHRSTLGWQPAPPPRAVQIHNTYLVAETDDGLMVIDQHALHERILYEDLRRRITAQPLESQRLLMLEVVRVPPDRLAALETHADTLHRLGILLTPAGPRSVAVQAFPTLLERVDVGTFVQELLDLLSEAGQRPNTESLLHAVLDMAACKAAVKAGDPLNAGQIAALLSRRELAEQSSHCPHGRPTTLHLTLRDLERQFKRR